MVTSEIRKKRIIGAGLPRTGTTSLTAALERLGYGPVLHAHKDDEAKAYASLLAAKLQYPGIGAVQLETLKKLTCPYNATLDSPTADFYAELADLYPESLVILTVRDTDKQWWSSWNSTLGSIFDLDWEGRLRRGVLWAAPNHASRLQMMMNYTLLWRSKYGEYGPQVHKQHNLEVARRIAPDRLLVFNVKEGWSPLCTFLGVKVPSEPFPHRNDIGYFSKQIHHVFMQCLVRWIIIFISFIVVVLGFTGLKEEAI